MPRPCNDYSCYGTLEIVGAITIAIIITMSQKKTRKKKLQHANSILESFEYFCQMSSKSILIILRYTVSKFACFFWDTVYLTFILLCTAPLSYRWEAP